MSEGGPNSSTACTELFVPAIREVFSRHDDAVEPWLFVTVVTEALSTEKEAVVLGAGVGADKETVPKSESVAEL